MKVWGDYCMFMERIICAGASEIHLRHIRVKEALIHSQSQIF